MILLALAALALAVDGAREISQTCAVNDGCFSGDAAGFPVTLPTPGKYVLTSDLDHDPNTHGAVSIVTISADDVTLDLNGFSLLSTSTCAIGSCATGSVQGIDGSGRDRVTVRDGRVVGVDANCIRLGAQARVERMTISHCGFIGVDVGANSIVRDSTIVSTGQHGLTTTAALGTIYESCTFAENGRLESLAKYSDTQGKERLLL